MKFLFLSHIHPPAIDGGSRVIYKVAERFAKRSSCLFVTTNLWSTDNFVDTRQPAITQRDLITTYQYPVLRLPVYRRLRRLIKAKRLFLARYLSPDSRLVSLLLILEKGPFFKIIPFITTSIRILFFCPDVIIAGPFPTTIALYARFFRWLLTLTGSRPILLLNSSYHQGDDFFHQPILLDTLSRADIIWSLSQSETCFYTHHLDIPPDHIIQLGNGVDSEFVINPRDIKFPRHPHLLYIGSFAQHKRLDWLINAFVALAKVDPQARLTLAGQRTLYSKNIEQLINTLDSNIHNQIEIIYQPSDYKIQQLIDLSSLLVLPSTQESFGLVLIESLARGKPFVASDLPPIQELAHKSGGGLTFATDNFDSLLQTITKLSRQPIALKKLGRQGRMYVKKHHRWRIIAKHIWHRLHQKQK